MATKNFGISVHVDLVKEKPVGVADKPIAK
jgi:hypothetical protein